MTRQPSAARRTDPRRGTVHAAPAPFGRSWTVLLAMLLAATGCASTERVPAPGPTPEPSAYPERPTTRPDVSLSPEALLTLDQLEPPVPAPENPTTLPVMTDRAEAAFQRGQEHLRAEEYARAAEHLERARSYQPDHPLILRALGLARWGAEDYGQAARLLGDAADRRPDDARVQLILAHLARRDGRDDDAILRLRRALKCSDATDENPVTAEALATLGQLLYRRGDWTASLECFDRLEGLLTAHRNELVRVPALRELIFSPETLYAQRGLLLLRLGRHGEAADALRRAHQRDRTDVRFSRLLMAALSEAGRYDETAELFVELGGTPVQRPQLPALAAMLSNRAKDPDLPRKLWQAYRDKREIEPGLAVALAELSGQLGNQADAAAILTATLRESPDSLPAARALGDLYARGGQVREGLRMLADLLARDVSSAEAVRNAVTRLGASEEGDEGLARRFAEQDPSEFGLPAHAFRYVAGVFAASRGSHLLAVEQFRRAIDAREDFFPAYEALADAYLDQGRDDRLAALLADLREIAADEAIYPYLRAKVLLERGQAAEALARLREARDRRPQHLPTLLLTARALTRLGEHEEAASVLTDALELRPDHEEIYHLLFDIAVAQNEPRLARQVVERLLRQNPGSVPGRLMLARLHLLAGRSGEARQVLDAIRDEAPSSPDVRLLTLQADLDLPAGMTYRAEFDRGIGELEKILREEPDNLPARRLLVQLLQQAGEHAQAAAVLGQIYELSARDPQAARQYLGALMRIEQFAEALPVARALHRADPGAPTIRVALVEVLTGLGRYDEAARLARQWLDDAPPGRERAYRTALLQVYREAGDLAAAREVIRAAVTGEDSIRDFAYRLLEVRLLEEADRYDEAQAILDALLDEVPPGERAEMLRAMKIDLYVQAGQPLAARACAEDWIDRAPDSLMPRRALIAALLKARRYERALDVVEDWLGAFETPAAPTSGPVTRPSAQAETAPSTRPGEATIHLAANTELRDFLREYRARLLLVLERYDEALAQVDEALGERPDSADLHMLRAYVLRDLGRGDEYLEAIERAGELAPDDPGVNNNIAYTLAEEGIRLDEAEELARAAVRGAPGESSFQDTLGWVYYKQGRMRKAGAVLRLTVESIDEEQLEQRPTMAVVLDHAGDAYYRLGWRGRAMEAWRRAADVAGRAENPDPEVRAVRTAAAGKLRAVRQGREPDLAPLGEEQSQQ